MLGDMSGSADFSKFGEMDVLICLSSKSVKFFEIFLIYHLLSRRVWFVVILPLREPAQASLR
jgi:hypothetical protein